MPVERIGLDDYVKRYEGDKAIRNVPPNEKSTPDYSNYRTAPYERELVQEQDRWTNPASYDAEQKRTWERSFQNDPDWRLLKPYSNTWMHAPAEPTSEQYRQGKNAMEELTENVERMVTPGTGTYNPDYVPMRGGNGLSGEGPVRFEQRHFDPARSQDRDMAAFPPPPIPGQLPTPPGTGGYGPIGQTVADVFSPAPPGTDPMSFRPTDLLRQLREGFISDEDIAEIERDPKSWGSLAAYGLAAANAAINLSRGAGKGEKLNWRIVPGKEWDAMKVVQEPVVGAKGEVLKPAIRQDDAGNHFEYQGSHVVQGVEGPDKFHVIAKPVEGPGIEPGSKEWFDKKAIDFQEKHFPDTPPHTLTEEGKKDWPSWSDEMKQTYLDAMKSAEKGFPQPGDPTEPDLSPEGLTKSWEDIMKGSQSVSKEPPPPDTPAQKKAERLRQLKQAQSDYLESLKKGPHSEDDAAAWKHYIEEELGGTLPPKKLPKEPYYPKEQEAFEKWKKGELSWDEYKNWHKEGVGPVDWNWYNPVGGKNPPYEPPFEVPPGWDSVAKDDMGPRSADFWERFEWKPPPDPNSPDFPGPNRWDYQPPPE